MDYYSRENKKSLLLKEKKAYLSEEILKAIGDHLVTKEQLDSILDAVLDNGAGGQPRVLKFNASSQVDFDEESRKKAEKHDGIIQKLREK